MIEDLRDRWLKHRYRKKKKVEVEADYIESVELLVPLHIYDGEESFSGAQPIEISFENVSDISDIEIDTEGVEIESIDIEQGKIIAWIHREYNPDTSFYIYYGRKNEWARAYDDEFKRDTRQPEQNGWNDVEAYHLEDY